MKRILLIFLFTLGTTLLFSQEKDTTKTETVTFAIIENPPVFPGCEKLDKPLQKMCLQNQIAKHVAKNFNTGMANTLGLDPGKKRIFVVFLIAADGKVKNIRARGPHTALEAEGMRVIKLLPIMTPGTQKGTPVGVKYTLPITLLVDKKPQKEKIKN